MSSIDSQVWTHEGNISATRLVFRTRVEADGAAKRAEKNGKRVTRQTSFFRDPNTGDRGRHFVVTIRPKPAWETYAEKRRGYGH